MHSICFEIHGFPIHWYGVMMAVGFVAGLVNWVLLGKGEGRDFNFCSDLLFWVMVSGIVGARLAYVLSDWQHYSGDFWAIFRLNEGGLIYYGGFISSGVALYVFARVHKQKFLSLVDFVVTSVPVAHAFGRIGCLLHGCCYGAPCASWLGVTFPGPRDGVAASLAWNHHVAAGWIERIAARSLPVYPVQLYESAINVLLFLALRFAYRKKRWDGAVTTLYLAGYAVMRFWLEFVRGDRVYRVHWAGLSSAQWVSLLLLLAAAVIYLGFRPGNADVVHEV